MPDTQALTTTPAKKLGNPENLKPYHFTKANSVEMAMKAVASRMDRLRREAAELKPPLPPTPVADYQAEQLTQVRNHLRRIDRRLMRASNALDIDRLARARGALAEQERKLAGRPDPGSYRPTARRGAARDDVEPL